MKKETKFIGKKRWVSDLIGDTYTEWTKHILGLNGNHFSYRIFIESETGTGKTSFILDTLLPFAKKNNRHILYLCNRISLREQIKNKLEKKDLYPYTVSTKQDKPHFKVSIIQDGVETYVSDDNKKSNPKYNSSEYTVYGDSSSNQIITVCNYQSVHSFLRNGGLNTEPYYIIFDEAHFFIEDSLFNTKTHETFTELLKMAQGTVQIFMSATIHDFRNLYNENLKKSIPTHTNQETYEAFLTLPFIEYINTYRNTYRKFFCYKNNNELIHKIKKSKKDEKWLIMVRTKDDGKNLKRKIREETGKTVRFISAASKNTVTWSNLIETNTFTSDVLIATKVIDNGISICDDNIKHIVLPFCNQTDFVQMLGRCRLSDKSTASIYIEEPSIQKINFEILLMQQKEDVICRLDKIKEKKFFQESAYDKEMTSFKRYVHKKVNLLNLLYIDKDGEYCSSYLALNKLKSDLEFYKVLKENTANPDNYINLVREWLNLPDDIAIKHIYSEEVNNLNEFITYYLDKEIAIEDIEFFYSSFQYYYKRYCYQHLKNDTDLYEKILKIKKRVYPKEINNKQEFKIRQSSV